MASRFSDTKRKQILADHAMGMTVRKLADKYGCSTRTVQNILHGNTPVIQEAKKKIEERAEQDTYDILAHMERQKIIVGNIYDLYLEKLQDPDILKRATPNQLASAMKTLHEMYVGDAQQTRDINITFGGKEIDPKWIG